MSATPVLRLARGSSWSSSTGPGRRTRSCRRRQRRRPAMTRSTADVTTKFMKTTSWLREARERFGGGGAGFGPQRLARGLRDDRLGRRARAGRIRRCLSVQCSSLTASINSRASPAIRLSLAESCTDRRRRDYGANMAKARRMAIARRALSHYSAGRRARRWCRRSRRNSTARRRSGAGAACAARGRSPSRRAGLSRLMVGGAMLSRIASRREDRLDRAGRAEQMADRRLGRGHRDLRRRRRRAGARPRPARSCRPWSRCRGR